MVTGKVLVDLFLFQKYRIFAGALLSEDVTLKNIAYITLIKVFR
jgi:hypothetical protein